ATVALLAGMQGAEAQSAPGAGSFPGSFLVPGTQTSFKVGGYVKGDFTYDFSAQQNINGGAAPTSAPYDGNQTINAGAGHNIHGTSQMTASESRFNIETRTPTGYGELKTYIEGDFTNPNGLTNSGSLRVNTNSYGFRLRYAYGTLGPVLVGQYNSVFRDSATEPETLDFGGAIVAGVTRQPQVRYTFDFGNGLTLAAAAENPQANVVSNEASGGGTAQGTGTGNKIPDFTAALKYAGPWGEISGRAVFRDVYYDGANLTGSSSSTFGWALGVSGAFQGWWGKDNASFQINGGQGAGRYVFGAQLTNPDSGFGVGGTTASTSGLKPIGQVSGMVQYQHWWTDMLRSTVAGSYAKQYVNNNIYPTCGTADPGCLGSLDHAWTVHVNLIWSPVPQVDTGIEWIRMQAHNQAGLNANTNRIQTSMKFKF
ncbi:MAG TPA: DcaP family trimeric outer membrane transporter, partial [Steroidobacteraceae bacterium]|nr:DcaP family trimeric outer membrane transporter [Steroidobacteraceae bacterium]